MVQGKTRKQIDCRLIACRLPLFISTFLGGFDFHIKFESDDISFMFVWQLSNCWYQELATDCNETRLHVVLVCDLDRRKLWRNFKRQVFPSFFFMFRTNRIRKFVKDFHYRQQICILLSLNLPSKEFLFPGQPLKFRL